MVTGRVGKANRMTGKVSPSTVGMGNTGRTGKAGKPVPDHILAMVETAQERRVESAKAQAAAKATALETVEQAPVVVRVRRGSKNRKKAIRARHMRGRR